MEYGDVNEVNKRPIPAVHNVDRLNSRRRLVVRPTPNLVCAPPAVFNDSDWRPVHCSDWNALTDFGISEGINDVEVGSRRRNCYTEVDYVNCQPQDCLESSSSASLSQKKPRCVATSWPEKDVADISLSSAFLDDTSCEAGSLVPEESAIKQHTRHKYDALIDPSLSATEKKRQRRILANRASARRSRQKKKERETYLLQRELHLAQERDAAIQSFNEQIRVNLAMRHQLQVMREKLNFYEKKSQNPAPSFDNHDAMSTPPMTDSFLSLPMTANEAMDALNPFVPPTWRLGSM